MTSPHATPDDGRPSIEARARLAEDLHDQLASSRMAWDAALLRSDAALASGDQAEVQAALADHRLLLGVLEERLGAVVAAATVTREAEQVVRGSATVGEDLAPPDVLAPPPAASAADARHGAVTPPPGHRLVGALAGVAAALALLTGVLGADLRLGTDGLVAGTTTQDEPDVRARVAATSVVPPALPGFGGVAGPRAALPRFSGSLPPATAPTEATDGPSRGAAAAAPSPVGTVPDGREGDVAPEVPTRDGSPTVDAPDAPDLPRPEELVERLAEREGGDGEEVDASIPSTVTELVPDGGGVAGVQSEVPIAPSASDPTGGLG